jgi:predicted ATPase
MAAECEAHHGRVDTALSDVENGLRLADEMGERYWLPQLHLLRGSLLLARDADAVAEAEPCFRRAIAIAREQSARLPELQATTRLARVLRETGRAAEARSLLEPIWASFSEGRETADGKEAQSLLDEL